VISAVPPTKQKAHPCGGLFVLLATRWKLNRRPARMRGRRASNKQHLRAVCSPERHSLASECAACKAAWNSSSTAASLRTTMRMQARWLARMVTSEQDVGSKAHGGLEGTRLSRMQRDDRAILGERSSPKQFESPSVLKQYIWRFQFHKLVRA
jgi:hypothetical protein